MTFRPQKLMLSIQKGNYLENQSNYLKRIHFIFHFVFSKNFVMKPRTYQINWCILQWNDFYPQDRNLIIIFKLSYKSIVLKVSDKP